MLECLSTAAEKGSVAVHASVLMTNQVHRLVTATDDGDVPAVLKRVGQHDVQHVNRTCHRTGGPSTRRFRSSLIEADGYPPACQRDIELNPFGRRGSARRATIAGRAIVRMRGGSTDAVMTPHALPCELADSGEARPGAYRSLFAAELRADCWNICASAPTAASCSAAPRSKGQSPPWAGSELNRAVSFQPPASSGGKSATWRILSPISGSPLGEESNGGKPCQDKALSRLLVTSQLPGAIS